MTKYKGECFCGSVQVEVTGEPAVMAICHCKLCRGWSAAPVTGAALWEPENFKVSKGEEFLSSYSKVQGHDRKWCNKCGGHVYVDHSTTYGKIDVYASILKDFEFTIFLISLTLFEYKYVLSIKISTLFSFIIFSSSLNSSKDVQIGLALKNILLYL